MLSKKDVDLLYPAPAVDRLSFLFGVTPEVVLASAVSVAAFSSDSPIGGDPEAIASLIRSSLLNLAFADSKS